MGRSAYFFLQFRVLHYFKVMKEQQHPLIKEQLWSVCVCVCIDTSFSSSAALAGSMGGLFTDGEESATANPAEDISKWSVEDVCGFISSLAGCAEYTQVRT